MTVQTTSTKRFRQFSAVTIIAVYLLIAVGGIVRSTGSGMGCPDWPKCFGSWIPPTDVSQLPDDYKATFVAQRVAKNEKFANYLAVLRLNDLANQVKNDPSILEEEDFNAAKTWIEYINRLIGVVIGFLILGTAVFSVRFWKTDRMITVLSFLTFVLVGFQGWIGSIVVSTNLLQWMITIHMLLAILIVCLLIYVYFRASNKSVDVPSLKNRRLLKGLILTGMVLTLVQVVLGTQVREAIDEIANELSRSAWVENLGLTFLVHRSYSLILLALHGYLLYMLRKEAKEVKQLRFVTTALFIIVSIEIASGAVMAYFAVPAFIQPIHLLLGTMIIGIQYLLWLQFKFVSPKIG